MMEIPAEYHELAGPVPATWTLNLWQAYDPASKANLHSTAIAIEDGGLYFIDPIALGVEALAELLSGPAAARPAGVLVTNGNHARAAADFACRFGVSLASTAAAAEDAGLEIDMVVPETGGRLFGGAFEAIPLTGAAIGEVAYYHPQDGGLAIVGDALVDFGGSGLMVLPDKYCEDPKRLRQALAELATREFSMMTLAHGDPITDRASERLRELLA